jgi:hypothetical protein
MAIADARNRFLNSIAMINNAGTNIGGICAAISATPGDGITSPTTGMICATTDGLLYRYTGSTWASIASGGNLGPIPVNSSLTYGNTTGDDRTEVAQLSSGKFRTQSYGDVEVLASPDSTGSTGDISIKAESATGGGTQGRVVLDGRSVIATAIPNVTTSQTVSRASLMHTVTVELVSTAVSVIAPFSGFIAFMTVRKTVSTGGVSSQVVIARNGTPLATFPWNGAPPNQQVSADSLTWAAAPSFSNADTILCTPSGGDAECVITFYFVRTS